MPKFKKKPIVIDAVQWTGDNRHSMIKFADGVYDFYFPENSETMTIYTLEGPHTANKGDWIIKGIKGEFYPCKPDIFTSTYDPVED